MLAPSVPVRNLVDPAPVPPKSISPESIRALARTLKHSMLPATEKRLIAVFLGRKADALDCGSAGPLIFLAMSQTLEAFVRSFGGRVAYTTAIDRREEECPPIFRSATINGTPRKILCNGWMFIVLSPSQRIVVRFGSDGREERSNPFCVAIYGLDDVQSFFDQWHSYARLHNCFRGQAVFADGESIERERPYSWDDVILSEHVRRELRLHVEVFLKHSQRMNAAGLKSRRGVILAGPPGTGKTLIGKVLAGTLGATFLWVLPRHLRSTDGIGEILAAARFLSPAVLFLEDLDLIGEDRDSSNSSLLGELMNQLDGASDNRGVVTIATTNRLEVVERALRNRPGRFDRVIEVGAPDAKARHNLLQHLLTDKGIAADDIEKLAGATDGYTPAQLEEAVSTAYLLAVEQENEAEGSDSLEALKITRELLERALREVGGDGKKGIGFG
jgi:hypothetical protein